MQDGAFPPSHHLFSSLSIFTCLRKVKLVHVKNKNKKKKHCLLQVIQQLEGRSSGFWSFTRWNEHQTRIHDGGERRNSEKHSAWPRRPLCLRAGGGKGGGGSSCTLRLSGLPAAEGPSPAEHIAGKNGVLARFQRRFEESGKKRGREYRERWGVAGVAQLAAQGSSQT